MYCSLATLTFPGASGTNVSTVHTIAPPRIPSTRVLVICVHQSIVGINCIPMGPQGHCDVQSATSTGSLGAVLSRSADFLPACADQGSL